MLASMMRIPTRLRKPVLRALAVAAAIGVGAPAVALELGDDAPSTINVANVNPSVPQKLNLGIGKSVVIELPRDAKEVFVANPKVANAVVRSTRKVFLIAMADGATSVFVMDAQGAQIANLEILVGRDMNKLRRTLKVAMPNAAITVTSVDNTVILTGEVASALEAQQAADIAGGFVGHLDAGGKDSKGNLINSLTVRARDQVMVKVTIAEVRRDIIKQLGMDITGTNWRIFNSPTNFLLDFPITSGTSQPVSATSFRIQGSAGSAKTLGDIKALEKDGVARILAEPTLTAISGEASKFTAGGTFPVPSGVPTCSASGNCVIGIDFKPYGVTLGFTPVVLSAGRISMRITTEVTEIDFENTFQAQLSGNTSVNVPGTRTRQAESTVELPSGGAVAIAGLIQQNVVSHLNGLPGLMKLPILGALFRSRDYQRNETELAIIATPYIVKPVAPSQIARPDDNFVDATDAQAILLGKFNKIYGVAGSNGLPSSYRGTVGFIHD
ncbi:pilus assembly protein CpaC [Rhizobiales bacterium GAS188]|nr:pilus assembly protein CpaC [Rhizobiales bacterium GAS188]